MSLIDRQREVMAHAWHCFDAEPKVNCEKLAALAGFANAASANAFWHKIKAKLVSTPNSAGTISKPSGIASKQRGRLKGSKCISKKPPKLKSSASGKKLEMSTGGALLPMQRIPLESGSLNDRSGHFNHRSSPQDTAAITGVILPDGLEEASLTLNGEEG
ncbi:uncharacterized protein CLAFUR5_04018 [Fulvia fulva]|uniref:Uncharacterized protein n=1 Tax=Passalora fulva TaxID=5499 RepID=A0A9Q8LH63_PASFU|nr:uncharacterized protein CLAFUR5_04018 [Fulvia fulva]KAK4628080.1 hypothetical protein CLAFUR0_04041 [Fulvia fulva]UJO16553.1 hypothetical protein CLAFUR5_04018 [Fulvia fulva]